MNEKLRKSGIDIIGNAPWGTHFCQFYKNKEDLTDILVPYFKAGLENNEFCMWITSEPLLEQEAKEALQKAIPDIDRYLKQGQIEIIPYTEWYVIEGSFDSDRVLNGWVDKLNNALEKGFDGLRLTGNTFWLEKENWNDFIDYEEAVDNVIGKYNMIALCTYSLEKCTAAEIIDVVNNHEFALAKREGKWELIESSEHKRTKEELIKAHDNLEEQVEKRTAELQIERNKLNNILNTTKNGIYIVNNDYEIEYINPVIEKEFGLVKGSKCYEYFYNQSNECSECKIKEAFEGNMIEWEQDSFRLGKVYDGLATPIRNIDGSNSVVVILNDVTKRKIAKEKLKTTINELKRSNKELKSFAYITSHDLQEPLRTIASYAQLIEMRYKGQLDSDADDFLDYMVSGASRMQGMIHGLLDYSRIGTQGGEFTEFNSEEAHDNALFNLRSSIEECNAEITYNNLPTIIADKDQISRVFQNLIGNALKFHREGVQPKIHISAKKEDNEYIFSVTDNGIGIEEQYTDKIFEVFKRLHAIGEYQGAGIGLAVVKRIVERHEGRIWIESSFGVGSTFYFTIPIKNE